MSLSSKIVKNTTYLSLSSILQKVLAFWWFTYVASQLQEDILGKYTFAVTYTSIFVILMNFGLIPVLIREGSKYPEQLQDKFNQALSLKIILTLVSSVVLVVVFQILNLKTPQSSYTSLLVYLAIGIIVFDTFRSIIFAVLRAQQLMHYEAIGQFMYQVVVVIAGLILFALGYKAGGLIIAINIASILYLIFAIIVLLKKTAIRFKWQWNWSAAWKLLTLSIPFALADVFFKLNGSLDTVMLEYLAGDRYVAWYNIALKLTITLTVIPGAFATAFFPVMSQAAHKSETAMRDIFEQFTILLLLLSLPLTVGTIVLAPSIVGAAFKDFPAAIPALQLLMVSLVFLFANYPIGNALNAANKQVINTINMGIALGVNIVLNILFIPQYTHIGAAVAATVTAAVLIALGLPHVYQLTHFRWKMILYKAMLTGVAAAVMGVVVWWLQAVWPHTKIMFVVIVLIGGIVYCVTCLVVRAIRLSELRMLWKAFRQRSSLQ